MAQPPNTLPRAQRWFTSSRHEPVVHRTSKHPSPLALIAVKTEILAMKTEILGTFQHFRKQSSVVKPQAPIAHFLEVGRWTPVAGCLLAIGHWQQEAETQDHRPGQATGKVPLASGSWQLAARVSALQSLEQLAAGPHSSHMPDL